MNETYRLIKEEYISDLGVTGSIYEHVKTGARLCHIGCDDDNKVFYIGFRTPPKDSTGVAHIVEHTVLCGSKKYPVKDPFVELCKGSLNTFLNAMTYPDKTVYPVASTNAADFRNLVDIYMDAVFNPNLYVDERIFKQEGWHYELDNADDELKINGVVYNEMKGAFSNPDDVLSREVLNSLFPDNTYKNESGGDPKCIPELTYEAYKEFHSTYYHPSNSFIYLYGDMDIVETMEYLDREYLSKYDALSVDSEIPMHRSFDKPVDIRKNYPIAADAAVDNSTYLSWNVCMGDALNAKESVAFDILEGALFSRPGAPLREALEGAKIGEDVFSSFENGIRQFTFTVGVKNANESDKNKFLTIINEELSKQVIEGIDRDALEAGLNSLDFRLREADFGSFPKGLMYGLKLLDSWLYDKDQPFLMLNAMNVVKQLRKELSTDYFERLVSDRMINNPHVAVVTLVPEAGLTTAEDMMLKNKLAEYKATLSAEEIDRIVRDTADLKKYQETPNTQEELECVPLLTRGDLDPKCKPIDNEFHFEDGVKLLAHRVNTNGISYIRLAFDVTGIPFEDLKYLSLMDKLTGMLDSEEHTYEENSKLVFKKMGSMGTTISQYMDPATKENKIIYEASFKYLSENFDEAYPLFKDIILHTKYDDKSRIRTMVSMLKSRIESTFSSAGNGLAIMKVLSSFDISGAIRDQVRGLGFYRFIKDFDDNFDEKIDSVIEKLHELTMSVFTCGNLLVDVVGLDEQIGQAALVASDMMSALPNIVSYEGQTTTELKHVNVGLKDAAQIQYVARAGHLPDGAYSGAYKVLKTILGYGYFWENVRVKGGAYGCMSSFTREGSFYFCSYRDPHLKETNQIFEKTPEYIESLDISDRDMTKYVIGTVGGMDTPLTPFSRGDRGYVMYMSNVSLQTLQDERDAVINCSLEDIKATAKDIRTALAENYLCVVGNEGNIEANVEMFDCVEAIVQ